MIGVRPQWIALLCAIPFVVACSATLRGVPRGFGPDDTHALLDATTVRQSLSVATTLADTYASARNECIEYRFWTSASYIPLAAIASWAIYAKASGDVLAATGLVAGGVAASGTLVNAANNGSVYQHGIDAIHCVQLALHPYSDAGGIANRIDAARGALHGALASATALGEEIDRFPDANKDVLLKADALAALLKARKALETAISGARDALVAADAEVDALRDAPRFAGTLLFTLDGTVASKIAQGSVDYAGLVTSMSGAMSTGSDKKTKEGGGADESIHSRSMDEPKRAEASAPELAARATQVAAALAASTKVLTALVEKSGFTKAKPAAVQCLGKI